MKSTSLAVVLIAVVAVGCGGGGGGGSPAATNTGGSSSGTGGVGGAGSGGGTGSGGGVGSTGGGGATIGTAPASIRFPWRTSVSTGSSIVVRGYAFDADGVAAVSVNGIPATLTPVAVPAASAKTQISSVQAITGATIRDSHDTATTVEWSAEVDLSPGDNDVSVDVEDSTGDVTGDADTVDIRYVEVPLRFAADGSDPRIVGWSTSYTAFDTVTRLVEFNQATTEQTVYPELTDIGIAGCLRGSADEYVYLILGAGGLWEVKSFDLVTRQTQLISVIPSAQISAAPGYSTGPLLMSLACSGVNDSIYLLVNYWEDGDAALSRVLEIDSAGNSSILTETDPMESPLWLARSFVLGPDSLVSVYDISEIEPLTRIDLATGARTELAPVDVGGIAIASALEFDRVYVSTFDGVDEVTVGMSPGKTNISVVSATDPLIFSQADSLGLDLGNNRVVVGDSDLDVLIAVDIATGARSELVSRKVGNGPPLITPRGIALNSDMTYAYIADDGSNAPERLFEVDLATGNRRVIGQIHEEGINRSLTGIALDEQDGVVYVARYDGGTVLRVDLAAEAATAITADTDPDGYLQYISDLVLDETNRRLLIADAGTHSIVAVDVVTLQKEIISQAGTRGDGDALVTPASMAMSADGSTLYVTDQDSERLVRVDIATGDRVTLGYQCGPGIAGRPGHVAYDPASDSLLATDYGIGLVELRLADMSCRQVRSWSLPLLDLHITPTGELLAAAFNSVVQVDRVSGHVVIVAK